MNIRILNDRDAYIFQALRIEAVNESPNAFREPIVEITNKYHEDVVEQLLPHGRGDFVLGAFDDEQHLVGIVGFYRADQAQSSHKGTLWGMYVTPAKRQQGVGRALVAAVIERATKQLNIVNITLSVTTSNEAAKRLYASQGFQTVGVERKALHIDGVYFDEALMQLVS